MTAPQADWTLDELLDDARTMLRGLALPPGCTVTVEADPAAGAVRFVGRRDAPAGAAVIMLDLAAAIEDPLELLFARSALLDRLHANDLPACGPDDVPPVVQHIRAQGGGPPERSPRVLN